MKILCLIDSLTFGGAQTQIVNIACDLQKYGNSVTIVSYYKGADYEDRLKKCGIHVICINKSSRFSILPVLKIKKIINTYNFDIALSFLYTPSLYLEFACLGQKMVKLVVSERSVVPDGKKTFLLCFFAWMHRFADAVTTNNKTHYDWLEKSFPWLRGKLFLIRNSVSLEFFTPMPSLESPKKSFRLSLLSVARVQPEKNAMNLIKAIYICIKRLNLPVTVEWAGEIVDKNYYAECCNLIKDLDIEISWVWLGVRSDINHLMLQHDALVAPSLFEGYPNAICEALASGLPVLGSNVCDIPQLVKHGVSGFLFNPISPESIASAIAEFFNQNSDQRKLMSENCRNFATANLSHERCSLEYLDLFKKVIATKV